MNAIFSEIPNSGQNPLLATTPDFHRYCKARFRKCAPFQHQFLEWAREAASKDLLCPAFTHGETRYYSTFQVWQVHHLICAGNLNGQRPADFCAFEALLKLLVRVQDHYLPQIRSDQRFGQLRDYGNQVAIGGTHFCTTTYYVAKALADERKNAISSNTFRPSEILNESGLSPSDLRKWIKKLMSLAEQIDPLSEWYLLVRFVSYSMRQKLKFESQFAQDLLEIAEILRLFHSEASKEPIFPDLLAHNESGKTWIERRFGASFSHPFEMLEYVSNQFGLNPTPRAVVLTEGEEWKAIYRLYESIGADPASVGIEIQPIYGEGNFSLQKWQRFIEYLHEKQVLVYFVLDREGQVESEAKRLLEKSRLSKGKGLLNIVPSKDRICIWETSFEEVNFTDDEIVEALRAQNVCTNVAVVASLRNQKQGLISALGKSLGVDIDKPQLCEDLVGALILWRRNNPNRNKRPVEQFVRESAELIVTNHLPTDPQLRHENRRTGLLG